MKEIEILVEVTDNNCKEDLISKLSDITSYEGKKHTIDVYFYDPMRVDLQINSKGKLSNSFRLRKKGNEFYMCYKKDHYRDGLWLYSDEHETIIGNLEEAKAIVNSLGLKELVTVDNMKYIFKNDLYEIVLEDVKNAGLFLEVEILSPADENILEQKNEIMLFISSLGIKVSGELNSGKPEIILNKIAK